MSRPNLKYWIVLAGVILVGFGFHPSVQAQINLGDFIPKSSQVFSGGLSGVGDNFSSPALIVARLFQIIVAAAGVIFMVMLLIGGIRYLSSSGNEEATGKAKRVMIDAIIGILATLAAWGVGIWILQAVGFSGVGGGDVTGSGAPTIDQTPAPVPSEPEVTKGPNAPAQDDNPAIDSAKQRGYNNGFQDGKVNIKNKSYNAQGYTPELIIFYEQQYEIGFADGQAHQVAKPTPKPTPTRPQSKYRVGRTVYVHIQKITIPELYNYNILLGQCNAANGTMESYFSSNEVMVWTCYAYR